MLPWCHLSFPNGLFCNKYCSSLITEGHRASTDAEAASSWSNFASRYDRTRTISCSLGRERRCYYFQEFKRFFFL